jgi:hypothetical protein
MSDYRLSYVPSRFVSQIIILDDLQLSAGEPPDTKKYENWYWTDAESAHVTAVRTKAEEYWNQMMDKKNCPPTIRDEMRIHIHDFMAYDHGENEPHKLLNKIADFGTIQDCNTVGVKRGTPLAKSPNLSGSEVVVTKVSPVIDVRINKIGRHLLTVRNPETPDRRALPDGIKFARIFCYIGTAKPAKLNQYEQIGNAKRGLFENLLENVEPTEDRLFAFYYGRYETPKGETWPDSDPITVEIYFPVP